jgi:selenocysteine lyase/cysteine desulfurase
VTRRYFDNAATSSPKPQSVWRAMADYAHRLGGSPGRGAYHESREAGRLMHQCRERIRRLINGESADHVVFALNTSDALNLAVKGILLPELARGGAVHAITTILDHNSVLRPLNGLAEMFPGRVHVTRLAPDPRTFLIDPDGVRRAVRSRADTRLVAVNHVSNVTGVIQPVGEFGRICREMDVPFLVDAAQSLGHIPVDVRAMHIDLLAFPGHKGLLGPTGTGGLSIRPGIERRLATLREGGTGSQSELDIHPECLPDKYEPGSQNAIGVIGLSEGVRFLLDFEHAGLRGIDAVAAHERELTRLFLDALTSFRARRAREGLRLLGSDSPEGRTGVFTLVLEGLDPHELSAVLESRFGVLTRAGLHCAPLAHRFLSDCEPAWSPARTQGTPSGGTRFSLGPFLTPDDVRAATDALAEIAAETDTLTPSGRRG